MTPLCVYEAALRGAATGRSDAVELVDPAGRPIASVDPAEWTHDLRPGDASLLERCNCSTLDVGCGPGRLAAALTRNGRRALGVDICAEAVRQARRRGATAMRGDVFAPVPREGRWHTVLLADGNIGIGGDPRRLLRRCAGLARRGGTVLAELHPPGERTWSGAVRLRYGERLSTPFAWAGVAASDAEEISHRAGLRVDDVWTDADRWFARLVA